MLCRGSGGAAYGVEKGTEFAFTIPADAGVVRAACDPERSETGLPLVPAAGERSHLAFDGGWNGRAARV